MNLHLIVVLHVLAEHPAWRVVELIIFDLVAGKGIVEGSIDERVERCVLHVCTPSGGCRLFDMAVGSGRRAVEVAGQLESVSEETCGVFHRWREKMLKEG